MAVAKQKIADGDERPEDSNKGDTSYRGVVDPASMVISPQEKIQDPLEMNPTIGGPGDPRMPSTRSFDTPQYGTETPYRKTPPTNYGSVWEVAATATPPSTTGVAQADAVANATPVAAVAPTIAGTTTSGQTLTCTPAPSAWVPAASSYTYQWYRSDEAIVGATAVTRVLAAADVGHKMKCRVTGVHATYGGSSPAFTAQTAVVA